MVDAADRSTRAELERTVFVCAHSQPGAACSHGKPGADDGVADVRPTAGRWRERELGFHGGVGKDEGARGWRDPEQLPLRVDAAVRCEELHMDADGKCRPDD